MKKRVLTLLLATTMVCGLFVGCGAEGSTNGQETATSDVAKEGTSEEKIEEKELVTIKVLAKNDYSADVKTEDWENYAVSKVVIKDLEEIGIRLEVEAVANDAFESVVNTRMASSSDVPDLIAYTWVGDSDNKVLKWGEAGLIYDLQELVDQYDEDGSIKAFYEKTTPGAWERNHTADGKLYWFNQLAGQNKWYDDVTGELFTHATPVGLSIRKDWCEELGIEWKEQVWTYEELYDAMVKMREKDANGNGAQDEILAVGYGHFDNGIAHGFGLTSKLLGGYYENEDVFFSNFYHENFPAYITFMNNLYNAGVLDPIMLSVKADQVISENRAIGAWSYADWDFEASLPEVEAGKDYYRWVIIDEDGDPTNGFPVRVDGFNGTTYNNFFVPKASGKAETIIKLFDYVYSDKYALLDQYGLEGDRYERNEKGLIVSKELAADHSNATFAETSGGLNVLPSLASEYGSMKFIYTQEDIDAIAPEDYMLRKNVFTKYFMTDLFPMTTQYEFSSQILALPTDEELAVVQEKAEVLNTYCKELLVDLIHGTKSIDDLADYQAEMDELGMQEYLAVMQARRDRVVDK